MLASLKKTHARTHTSTTHAITGASARGHGVKRKVFPSHQIAYLPYTSHTSHPIHDERALVSDATDIPAVEAPELNATLLQWSFNDFLQALKDHNVGYVIIREDAKSAIAYTNANIKHVITLPSNHDVINDLTKYNVPFELDTSSLSLKSLYDGAGAFAQFIFIGFLLRFIVLSFTSGGGGGSGGTNSIFGMGKNRAKKVIDIDITFADVAGLDKIRKEVEEVVDFMQNPEKYKKLGAKLPKGLLLSGPPGTGKTLIAKAIANEAGVPLFACAGSEFVEMFVGVGASRIRDLFEEARKASPSIIFIDEIDSIGRKRSTGSSSNTNSEQENAMNQLLTEMDGFGDSSNIVVIGATNRIDILDDALLRRGRFDRQIEVSLPSAIGREAIFNVHTRNKPLAGNVSLQALAKITQQFSGADIEYMCNEAAIYAARKGQEKVTRECFDYAFEKIIMGLENEDAIISSYKRRVLAIHEAGHTLIGLLVDDFDDFLKVSIIPRGSAGGVTYFSPSDDAGLYSQKYLLNKIMVTLGGRIAEELTLGTLNTTTGASGDFEQVFVTAKEMVGFYGFNETLGPAQWSDEYGISGETAANIDAEIRFCVEWCYRQARELMVTYEIYMIKIAESLMENSSLDSTEILKVVEGLSCDFTNKDVHLYAFGSIGGGDGGGEGGEGSDAGSDADDEE